MIRVGKIVATHGLSGDVIMTHITGKKNWLKKGDPLFVALRKDSHIPYFVAAIKNAAKDELVVLLEDIDSVESAKKLVGKEVFIEQMVLEKSGVEDSPLLWIGYTLTDKEVGVIGIVKDVFQTANQWLAEVDYKGNEVLIPLINPVLVKVDVKTKTVHVDLPNGLLEVYS